MSYGIFALCALTTSTTHNSMSKFSISCPHVESKCTYSCPRLVEGSEEVHETVVLCKECFTAERQAAQLLSLAPNRPENYCMDCGTSPARYNKSLMMSMCDSCRAEQSSGFFNLSFGRVSKGSGKEFPDNIYEGKVFLGSQVAAANTASMERNNITHVLICGNGLSMYYADEGNIRYHQLPIDDSLDQNLLVYLPLALRFIDDAVDSGQSVLVHCHAGVSRSASVVIAWIMQRLQWDYATAHSYVKSRRNIIYPNSNFVQALRKDWEPYCLSSDNPSAELSKDRAISLECNEIFATTTTASSMRKFSTESMVEPAISRRSVGSDALQDGEEDYDDFVLVLKDHSSPK